MMRWYYATMTDLRFLLSFAPARLPADTEAYLDFWRAHPALTQNWTKDVEAYACYDLTGDPGSLRSRAREDAVSAHHSCARSWCRG